MRARIGTTFFIVAWVILMALGYSFFDSSLDNRRNPNKDAQVAYSLEEGKRRLVLKENFQGHFLVSGKINDKDVEFLIDTGATTLAIPSSIAKDLGLTSDFRVGIKTATGKSYAYTTSVESITIAGHKIYGPRALVVPSDDDSHVLLGMSVPSDMDFAKRGDQLILEW